MKYLFQKGNQINKGRKSHRKGKTMIEEYGYIKAKEIKENIKNNQIGKHYFKMKINCEKCGKEEIVYTNQQKFCKECQRINKLEKRKKWTEKEINKFKQNVRHKTTKVFGKLEKGFEYHHYTEPYEYDKFFILESGVHRWLDKHPKAFKLGGLVH